MFNCKRYNALLRRAVDANCNGDWITSGRALALALSMLPNHIRIAVYSTAEKMA